MPMISNIRLKICMQKIKNRKSNRLSNYEYDQDGFYFITICTKDRKEIFGKIIDSEMLLNKYGEIAEINIININSRYDNVKIDNYIIMPNHIHLLIIIENENHTYTLPAPIMATLALDSVVISPRVPRPCCSNHPCQMGNSNR